MSQGWIGFDLDGTLAYEGETRFPTIGRPIKPMMDLLKKYVSEGREVRIFTARACMPEFVPAIHSWIEKHVGQKLEVTCVKDFGLDKFYDDKCFRVKYNTGEIVGD